MQVIEMREPPADPIAWLVYPAAAETAREQRRRGVRVVERHWYAARTAGAILLSLEPDEVDARPVGERAQRAA